MLDSNLIYLIFAGLTLVLGTKAYHLGLKVSTS